MTFVSASTKIYCLFIIFIQMILFISWFIYQLIMNYWIKYYLLNIWRLAYYPFFDYMMLIWFVWRCWSYWYILFYFITRNCSWSFLLTYIKLLCYFLFRIFRANCMYRINIISLNKPNFIDLLEMSLAIICFMIYISLCIIKSWC